MSTIEQGITPVRWGVLGAAKIAVGKVIPAMHGSAISHVVAIGSRDGAKAKAAAEQLGIPRAYGSYDELVDDPEIDVIYNPLPNHLHVPWTIRAAEAGKHVLCEKPIAMNAPEARQLLEVRARTGVLIGEAFVVHTNPQWVLVKQLVDSGRIGELRLIVGHFSYYRRDPSNIRSKVEYGGGALLDIGCYPLTLSRWLYGAEPIEVAAQIDRDPDMKIDRQTSAMLRFPTGQASFTCSTELVAWQKMQILGTRGRIEVEIPFNAPPDRPCRVRVDDGRDPFGGGVELIELPPVNQYTIQSDRFSRAVRGLATVPVSLEDGIANMAAMDAMFRAAETGKWEKP